MTRLGVTSDVSFYLPKSSLNEGQRMHAQALSPSLSPFASLRNRYDGGNVHSVQPPAQRQDRSYSITAEALARAADCCHPYWRNHGRPPLALPCFSRVYYRKQACFGMLALMAARLLLRARTS